VETILISQVGFVGLC